MRNLVFASWLSISLLAIAQAARADDFNVTLDATGTSMIGVSSGKLLLITKPAAGGPCTSVDLGPADTWERTVRLTGTSGDDVITFVPSPTTFCGTRLTPALADGPDFTVEGEEGNDIIRGAEAGGVFSGGPGDDVIVTPKNSWNRFSSATGGDGNDILIASDDPDTTLWGDGGDDLLCNFNATTNTLWGGDGNDVACGTAQTYLDIEASDDAQCSRCHEAVARLSDPSTTQEPSTAAVYHVTCNCLNSFYQYVYTVEYCSEGTQDQALFDGGAACNLLASRITTDTQCAGASSPWVVKSPATCSPGRQLPPVCEAQECQYQ